MNKKHFTTATLAFLGAALAFGGGKKETVVKIGIVGDAADMWRPAAEELAKEGVRLEIIEFADYIQPNQALEFGDIDMNAFQTLAFLETTVADRGYSLTPIGTTLIAPLGLYSKKITSLDQLKDGDSIAVSSDPVTEGRALKVLESFGLFTVNPDKGWNVLPSDIIDNPKHIIFVELDAGQTYRAMDDVAASMINGGHALNNGLNPERDSIVLEKQPDGMDNPFINVIAVRTADKDKPLYRRIVKAFQTDATKAVFETRYKGAYLPVW